MDVTHPMKFAWLASAVFILSMGTALAESSTPDEGNQSNSKSSARGSLVFVLEPQATRSAASEENRFATGLKTLRPMAPSKKKRAQPRFARGNSNWLRNPTSDSLSNASQGSLEHALQRTPHRQAKPGVRNPQPPVVRTSPKQSARVQRAVHNKEVVAPAKIDPIAKLLIRTHTLSLQAETEQEYTEIIQHCAEAIRRGADSESRRFAKLLTAWALNRRGQARMSENQQEQANADFRAALDQDPNNWRALHNRGVSRAQAEQFSEAFDDFNRVIQLNPRFAKAYANRATLYVQANDLPAALKDYHRASQLDKNLVAAQVGLASVCHQLGRWDAALEHYGAAVRLDPSNAEVVCSRGDLLADMGRYRGALADYARTIELNPEFAHAYRNGAWLLATCPVPEFRDAKNAIQGARRALDFGYGERHVALDTLAAAFANAGQFEEAVSTLQQAMSTAPDQAKTTYLSRLQRYQQQQPFRTQPIGKVSQAVYEVIQQ